jgi:hypothetical protein
MLQTTKDYISQIKPEKDSYADYANRSSIMNAFSEYMRAIKNRVASKLEDVTEEEALFEQDTDSTQEQEEVEQEEVETLNHINTTNMRAVSNIKAIQDVTTTWEAGKKKNLIALGESGKPYTEILAYLENDIANSTKMVTFRYKVSCFRNDGVYQLHRAIEEHIGVSKAVADQKPSGGGDRPIDTIDVVLADGSRHKVPFGTINLPDMGEDASIDIQYSERDKYLSIKGTCQFKFQTLIDTIVDRAKELLNTDSIYKNQAIEIQSNINGGQPEIMDLTSIDSEIMILSEETEYDLSPLTARIDFPERCIANRIPIKFGILIEGPYGTGKTLYAFKLANRAIKNNWSFIYLKSPELLADTLRMAKTLDKNGNGIIVFVEDIDQVTRGNRNAAMQDILNTLDGGDTKDMNVISLFTTNHLELIEPTFLRGKRIGTIVSMAMLTEITAKKYIDVFCEGVELIGDFGPVYKLIKDSGIAPAFMAEIIENVKSNMVIREEKSIKASHFINCVNSYLRQVKLSRTKDTSLVKEVALVELLRDNLMTDEFYAKIAESTEEIVDNAFEKANA